MPSQNENLYRKTDNYKKIKVRFKPHLFNNPYDKNRKDLISCIFSIPVLICEIFKLLFKL